jgi:formylglycine-generating enzyme required for sulfatase activity
MVAAMERPLMPNARRMLLACGIALVAACLIINVPVVFAETQTVIDPAAAQTPPAPPVAAKPPVQSDAAIRRERQKALAEQRKREKAEARALAAEKAAAQMRTAEDAREAREADAAAKVAAAKAAAAKRVAAKQAAVRATAAREAADREAAMKEAAIRGEAARELAARQAAAKEAAAKEAAAKEVAAREAATLALAIAAREAAAKEAAAKEAARNSKRPGTVFRDCPDCPEMVWLPRGEFFMGETLNVSATGPAHQVTINYPLAVGRFEVTFAEWDACLAARGCRRRPDDQGWGRGRRPVINVSWQDAQEYVAWLSGHSGKHYRLLSEAEWEYAARGGTQTRYWWGNDVGVNHADCYNCGSRWDGRQTAPAGSFEANPFGLYDMLGNASEWVQDCYHGSYRDAPTDGSAWVQYCAVDLRDKRVVRGGAWQYPAQLTRPAFRTAFSNGYYDFRIGFRVALTD